jgi:hypothetical protein
VDIRRGGQTDMLVGHERKRNAGSARGLIQNTPNNNRAGISINPDFHKFYP